MAIITAQEISNCPMYLPFATERVAVIASPTKRGTFLQLVLRLPMSSYQRGTPINSQKHNGNNYHYRAWNLNGHLMLGTFGETIKTKKAQKRLTALIKLAKITDKRLEEKWTISFIDESLSSYGVEPCLVFASPDDYRLHQFRQILWP